MTERDEAEGAGSEDAALDPLAAAQEEIATLKDRLLRAAAEAENARKRAERQVADARIYAIDRFARDLLSVADNLGRALGARPAQPDPAMAPVMAGLELTERELSAVLERHGVQRVGAPGERFDPNLHQAVAQAPSAHPAGVIAEVFQPGYRLADRTLRAAMVVVSLGPASSSAPADATGAEVDFKA
jgi:molecular chaperone GrpE